MSDRRRMKRLRRKRIESIGKQIEKHEDKIKNEKPVKDTTKEYWRKEIDEKFLKQIEEDEKYLEERDGSTDKKDD